MAEPPHWYGTEAEYTDAVVGDDTLGELFAASARRNADIDAQRYKGGVYDRSLAGGVVPEPPAGEYTSIRS
jgi:long-chain acyl-CoA synthetase